MVFVNIFYRAAEGGGPYTPSVGAGPFVSNFKFSFRR